MLRIHKATTGEPLLFPPPSPSGQRHMLSARYLSEPRRELWIPMETYIPCRHLDGGSVFRVPPVHFSASVHGRKSWPGKLVQGGVPFHANLTTPPSLYRRGRTQCP